MNEQITDGSLKKALIDSENALWGTLKNKHPERFDEFSEQFGRFFADDYRGVYAYGINAKSDEIEGMRWCSLQKYSLTEAEVTFPASDIAVVIYRIVTENFTKEQDISGAFNASSV